MTLDPRHSDPKRIFRSPLPPDPSYLRRQSLLARVAIMVDQENNPPFHFCQPTKTNPSVPPGIAGNENKPVILPRLNQLANPFTPAFGQVGFGNILSQGSTATNVRLSFFNKTSLTISSL